MESLEFGRSFLELNTAQDASLKAACPPPAAQRPLSGGGRTFCTVELKTFPITHHAHCQADSEIPTP